MLRVTLRIIPIINPVAIMEEPPMLTKGSGCPVTGNSPMDTPMLTIACTMTRKPNPKAIRAPKESGRLMQIRKTLVNRMIYSIRTISPPTRPYSSMMMA